MNAGGVALVGGGLASQRCAEMLRRKGFEGEITLVTGEDGLPYDRPPLSKGFLTGEVEREEVEFRVPEWYGDAGVELITGPRAARLCPDARIVELEDGREVRFGNLLIATGSRPRQLPALAGRSNVHYLRSITDSLRLRSAIEPGNRMVIIGGGFIGQEIASSALALGAEVTIVEALPQPLAGILGEDVGHHFAEFHREKGIEVVCGRTVVGASGDPEVAEVELDDGTRLECDLVVVGIGTEPEVAWLDDLGLDWRQGVPVDDSSRTTLPGIYAAGDVTRSVDPVLSRETRSEHWDAAVHQGRAAALDILGEEAPARSLPTFWSDQHGSRVQFVGHTEDADDVEIREGSKPGSLVARWSREGHLIGALALDDPRSLAAFRREIQDGSARNEADDTQTTRQRSKAK